MDKFKLLGSLGIALAVGCGGAFAQSTDSSTSKKSASTAGTSTGSDTRSSSATETKTSSKSSNAADRKLLADVRRAVVKDKSLSRSAHNVKITNNGGVITMKGTVPKEEEKSKLEEIAKSVSGVSSVENNLQIKGRATASRGRASDTSAGNTGTSGSSGSGSATSSGSSTKSN